MNIPLACESSLVLCFVVFWSGPIRWIINSLSADLTASWTVLTDTPLLLLLFTGFSSEWNLHCDLITSASLCVCFSSARGNGVLLACFTWATWFHSTIPRLRKIKQYDSTEYVYKVSHLLQSDSWKRTGHKL